MSTAWRRSRGGPGGAPGPSMTRRTRLAAPAGAPLGCPPPPPRRPPGLIDLIGVGRSAEIPVIWTIFAHTHLGLDRPHGLQYLPHLHPDWGPFDSDGVWPEMGYRDDEVLIRKPSYGAFHETSLDTILRNLG